VGAVVGAGVGGAIVAGPTRITDAGGVVFCANTVVTALVGASLHCAVYPIIPRVAITHAFIAKPAVRAVVGACQYGTVEASVIPRAVTRAVVASPPEVTIVRAEKLATVVSSKARVTVAFEILTTPPIGAVVRTSLDLTRFAHPTLIATAEAVFAGTVNATFMRTRDTRAVHAGKAGVAVARSVETEAVVAAAAGANAERTIIISPPWRTLTNPLLTNTIAVAVMWALAVCSVYV